MKSNSRLYFDCRGGSFKNYAGYCRLDYCGRGKPDFRCIYLGFRIALYRKRKQRWELL